MYNEEDIVQKLVNKERISDIAKEYKISKTKVSKIAHAHGIIKRIEKGQSFGRLTTKEVTHSNHYGKVWLCICECGNETEVSVSRLNSGATKSCGCLRRDMHRGHKEIRGSFWQSIKKGAKERNLKFEIDLDFAWELFLKQNKKCALTGLELIFGPTRQWTQTASLDRICSFKGYTKDNVQWVHKVVNRMKHNLTEDQFIYYCELIINNKMRNNNAKI